VATKTKWTILTFIAAHNNLQSFGKKSLVQISKVGSSNEVTLGAYLDSGPGRGKYVMGAPGETVEKDIVQSADSGDPAEVIKTAKWLFQKYPAERYGLILWSHGTGWEPHEIRAIAEKNHPGDETRPQESNDRSGSPGAYSLFRTTIEKLVEPAAETERAILFDDGSGHSLDTIELANVTKAIQESIGQPLDFLGMDACLMANLEVAYQLRKSVCALVASPELVPAHSWPYSAFFTELQKTPEMSGTQLAKLAVTEYLHFYTKAPPSGGDVTKVALDLTKIELVTKATDKLAEALMENMELNKNFLWCAQTKSRETETRNNARTPTKFDFHLWDLGSISRYLVKEPQVSGKLREAAQSVSVALQPGSGPVIEEGHLEKWFDQTAGVSIYCMQPGEKKRLSPYYDELAFAQDTQWSKMLKKYHALTNS
jgi:hypothetical protein